MLALVPSEWNDLTVPQRRDKIMQFQELCLSMEGEHKAETPVNHIFCEGVYSRTITIPAGVALVGEIHKYPCLNFVTKGVIRVATDEGVSTITAPAIFTSPAGTKRAGFVIEECEWTTVHATPHTDHKLVERDILVPSYQQLDVLMEKQDVICSDSSSSVS